jgi:ribosomal-protein-alanine N-acetyltransferase
MPAILSIERASFGSDAYPESLFRLYAADPRSFFLTAVTEAGSVIGYIIARVDRWGAEIISLAVLAEWRKQGIGEALLRGAIRRARRRDATSVRLMVRIDNLNAVRFYRSQGFRSIGRIADYYEDGTTAMRMRLPLTS